MSVKKVIKKLKATKLSMRAKLILSLSSIALVLLVSSIISVMEYSSMSNYVTKLIADDVSSINVANKLSEMGNSYNLAILEEIGNGLDAALPNFDDEYFQSHCDTLRMSSNINDVSPLADSLLYSYTAYMLTSMEFEQIVQDELVDTRDWFFNRLQPRFDRFRSDLANLTSSVYNDLQKNSATFERGFYRSVIPGIVAVGVGLLLVIMLLLFLLTDYVNPIYKMIDSLNAYRSADKKYSVKFDGDAELAELNEDISELVSENQQLRKRIKEIRK